MIAHEHIRTRRIWKLYPARLLPASVFRFMVRLGWDRIFWATEPHDPECTDEVGVLRSVS